MQCDNRKAFDHVSSVFRREKPRCPSCGKDHVMCYKSDENLTCCNCGGNHEATSFKCPTRVKENEVAKVRAIQSISYTAAVKKG